MKQSPALKYCYRISVEDQLAREWHFIELAAGWLCDCRVDAIYARGDYYFTNMADLQAFAHRFEIY